MPFRKRLKALFGVLAFFGIVGSAQSQSTLTSFFNPVQSLQEVFYVGTDQHVYEAYWSSGEWLVTDITGSATPVALGSGITSFFNPAQNLQEIFYVGTDQHVHEAYWSNGWLVMDVTGAATPAAQGSSLTSFFNPSQNLQELFYVGTDQHIHEAYWSNGWLVMDVTGSAETATAGGGLTSFFNPSQNLQELFYIGTDQHVHEAYWSNGWLVMDVTGAAEAAAPGSVLTSFFNPSQNLQELFYVGMDQHVYEAYWSSGEWLVMDVTQSATQATDDDDLTGFFNPSQSLQEVFYEGTEQHIHEAYRSDGWLVMDVTGSAEAAAPNSGITSFFNPSQNLQEVFYVGTDQHVYEAYWSNGWNVIDVTGANPTALTFYTAFGQVLSGGSALSGVTVNLSGTTAAGAEISQSTTTDSNGNYSFSLPAGGTYTVVPFLAGYAFNPPSSVINGGSENQIINSVASVQTGSVAQNCNDITGTWQDGSYTYSLTETAGIVTGTDTLILPYGSVQWTVSGQTTDGVNFSMRLYDPNPTTTDFGVPDQEDDFTLNFPTCSSISATLTNRITSGGSSFLGSGSPTSTNQTTTWTRQSTPATPPATADVTVIAWVDSAKISLPTPDTSQLATQLNTPGNCTLLLGQWAFGNRQYLNGPNDITYANNWLLSHSGNTQPPARIDASAEMKGGDFRLFNRFQILSNGNIARPTVIPHGPPVVGATPDPCGVLPKALSTGEAHPNNGFIGIDSLGKGVAQLAEGRVGTVGQAVNKTINGSTTPFIWSVIEFDSVGNLVAPVDHAIFPTYSIYVNGNLAVTCPQSDPASFISEDSSYQRIPSEIPTTSGLSSCHY